MSLKTRTFEARLVNHGSTCSIDLTYCDKIELTILNIIIGGRDGRYTTLSLCVFRAKCFKK
jgi:hypothetical protein